MAPRKPNRRPRKSDRLLCPDATKVEIECDYACAPLDALALDMDRKWGVDRLPELVSVETAQKYGRAMAHLNECIREADPARTAAAAQNCIKGLHALDAEATAAGHQPATGEYWEYELGADEGQEPFRFAIIRDQHEWPALKAKRPDLEFYTLREVAIALRANMRGPLLAEVKKHFPAAEVTAVKPNPPVDYANGGDEVPF